MSRTRPAAVRRPPSSRPVRPPPRPPGHPVCRRVSQAQLDQLGAKTRSPSRRRASRRPAMPRNGAMSPASPIPSSPACRPAGLPLGVRGVRGRRTQCLCPPGRQGRRTLASSASPATRTSWRRSSPTRSATWWWRHHDERITRQVGAAWCGQPAGSAGGRLRAGGRAGWLDPAQAGFLLPNAACTGKRSRRGRAAIDGRGGLTTPAAPWCCGATWRRWGARPPRWLSTHPRPASRLRELDTGPAWSRSWNRRGRAGRMPRCR